MNRSSLENTLLRNVCEVKFMRRRPIQGHPPHRRMLCTKCNDILNSANGRISLNYRAPSKMGAYDPASNNLVVVWDIFMQDYRMVPAESVQIIRELSPDIFWETFNQEFYPMSAQQKEAWMNS